MLLEPVREALQATGLPYVIENVEGAPLIDAVTLCSSQFGLTCEWPGNGKVALRRHRLFESTFPVPDPGPHDHSLLSVPVYGHGPSGRKARLKGTGHAQAERDVMRIDWMTREEINEAIPPAYTEYVGQHALLSGIGRADLHISEADQ
jgi:DNA (cytosine-5)-methyltransferase 1